ncbi:DUF3127 domain-containing protein [Shewanella sp. WXL01]|uniref:DUF3127 domain-containing protein n=1 Tax=Shewanella sp. WXL01 TaxID=2709721 RepID=UPI0014385971|nr:DUF3127 domain-containing protein [Shewanella sp. WXL01]NKF50719.1 DUF3127 domain-containing protein [Shewanella sp. WXL01]
MSKSYEMTGIIHSMGETTTYGNNGFTKREFVLKATGPDENSAYPNYIALELIKDNCSLLDQFNIGDELQVMFNLTGRLWQPAGKPERCFNALQVWKLSAAQPSQTAQSQPSEPDYNYNQATSVNQPTNFNQSSSAATSVAANQGQESKFASDVWDDDIPF